MEDKKQGGSDDHVITVNRHDTGFTEGQLYSMICKTLLAQNRLKIVWRLKEETKGECANATR